MRVKFEGKAVLNNHRLGVPNGREFSAKSLTKNPLARRDGMAMCSDLLKMPRVVYRVCSGVANNLKQQYSSKRCVSVCLLCDVIAAGQVPGLKSSTGYSTIRFARSITFQEWPRSQQIFADTKQDWNKWRVMGGSRRVIKALGIWDYKDAKKFRDRVGGAERKRIGVGKATSLGFTALQIFGALFAFHLIPCHAHFRGSGSASVEWTTDAGQRIGSKRCDRVAVIQTYPPERECKKK